MASALDAQVQWLDYLAKERRSSPRTLEAYGDAVRRYLTFLQTHRGEAITAESMGGITPA